ncbi:APC membrane recruitment protein 2 [Thomomys bottae]
MDLPGDCTSETPAPEQPSGKINKAAFKLFKKRKTGSPLPSIFGVKHKGDGKSQGPAGMVKSRTHDGLAEAAAAAAELGSGRKEEEEEEAAPERGAAEPGQPSPPGAPRASSPATPHPSSVAKSHSFFSLLKRGGRPDSGRAAEPPEAGRAAAKQKKGLRGILSSMRWHRRDRRAGGGGGQGAGKEAAGAPSPGSLLLLLPGSLTASLECVKEEPPRAPGRPASPPAGRQSPPAPAGGRGAGEAVPAAVPTPDGAREPRSPGGPNDRHGQAEDSVEGPHPRPHPRPQKPRTPPEPGADPAPSAQEPPSTGCGDIIADQEEEADSSGDKHLPGAGNATAAATATATATARSQKNPSVIAYQGGGEDMASPDGVGDTYLQEFWDMLSQTEDPREARPQDRAAKPATAQEAAPAAPETSQDARRGEAAKDASSVKRRRLHRIPVDLHPQENPKRAEKEEQSEGIPNNDEGYCDSTTPGPEEDRGSSRKKASGPRDSDSGDALYGLYPEPNGSPAAPPASEENTCLSRLKPVVPGAITCPLRTPGSLPKDSKIPISVKHLTNLPASHPVGPQQPARSDMPRTKIPVSKVLVRRVGNRGLAGTTLRAAACHDSAKKL